MRRAITVLSAVALIVGLFATAALAAWNVDAGGQGFVGKGDVQQVLGWNNKALQDNAETVQFRAASVSETSWTCQRDGAVQTQERARTTTTQGLVSHTERLRNQITGFTLTGWSGDTTTVTDGPAVGSCPTFWSEVDGSRETVAIGGSGLQVSSNGTTWVDLPEQE